MKSSSAGERQSKLRPKRRSLGSPNEAKREQAQSPFANDLGGLGGIPGLGAAVRSNVAHHVKRVVIHLLQAGQGGGLVRGQAGGLWGGRCDPPSMPGAERETAVRGRR